MNIVEHLAQGDDNADGVNDASLKLVQALTSRGETFAATESLTTDPLCATVASVPGASAVLRGGVVIYATNMKVLLADVPQDVPTVYDPMSDLTVRCTVLGVASKTVVNWGILPTDAAGPAMQDGHVVGEVWCSLKPSGVLYLDGVTAARLLMNGENSRVEIHCQAVVLVLALLMQKLDGKQNF